MAATSEPLKLGNVRWADFEVSPLEHIRNKQIVLYT